MVICDNTLSRLRKYEIGATVEFALGVLSLQLDMLQNRLVGFVSGGQGPHATLAPPHLRRRLWLGRHLRPGRLGLWLGRRPLHLAFESVRRETPHLSHVRFFKHNCRV